MKSKALQARQTVRASAKRKPRIVVKRAGQSARAVKAAELLRTAQAMAATPKRVPSRWRWHYRVLLSLQGRLLRERGELLRSAAEPVEPHSVDEADSATDEFDHDLALTQLSAGQDALYEVNEALSRILNGSYGLCEETGEVIPAARLRAIPWARFSIKVEDRLEKKGATTQARVRKAGTVRGGGRVSFAPEGEAEETEEKPAAPPKDEALTKVFYPPGRSPSRSKKLRRPPGAAGRKGRNQ
jgi:RNA polymerase-binding transcription factor DksA